MSTPNLTELLQKAQQMQGRMNALQAELIAGALGLFVSNPDPEYRRMLYGQMLDEDDGGSLAMTEIAHALRTNPAAKQLAQGFASLHRLVAVASARKRRRRSSV